MNIAGALFLGVLAYVLKNWALMKPANDSTYLYLRSMYRVVDFLGLQSQNPVATNMVRREFPSSSEQFGAEVFIIVTWLGMAAATALLLRLLRHTGIYRTILRPLSLAILLSAAPVSYLFVLWQTWNWPYAPGASQGLLSAAPPVEVLCLGMLLLFLRRKKIPKWIEIPLVLAHCGFWMFVLWSETCILFFPLYTGDLILLAPPISALMYILRRKRLSMSSDVASESRKTVWDCVLAVLALLVAGIVCSPARNIELSHPRNLDSITVELSRGPCFGSCPAYSVTVHGDGQVQYVGQKGFSRVQTKKSGTIPQEKVFEILQVLDHVGFMTLESRAFFWAFDTPTVGVHTPVDGKEKHVASDSSFVGSRKGRQARFVEAAGKIDGILASSTWLQCEGACQNSASSR